MLSLQAAEHVRHQSEDHGGVVILDTVAGLWIVLNPTAGDLWRSWQSGGSFEEGVAEVTARYPDVPMDSIRADAEELVRDLVARGLIEAVQPGMIDGAATDMAEPRAVLTGPRPGWLRIGAAVLILVVAGVLVRCSFRASFALVRASRRTWCKHAASPEQAAIAVAAVSRAARCYPGRAACLEQSLAAVLLAAARRRRLDGRCLRHNPVTSVSSPCSGRRSSVRPSVSSLRTMADETAALGQGIRTIKRDRLAPNVESDLSHSFLRSTERGIQNAADY